MTINYHTPAPSPDWGPLFTLQPIPVTDMSTETMRFDGQTYEADKDLGRLSKQVKAVYEAMIDHQWHTLAELEGLVKAPQASVSARLRDLRKPRFGGWTIERERLFGGVFAYRLAERDA